jgi:hypothetical protein
MGFNNILVVLLTFWRWDGRVPDVIKIARLNDGNSLVCAYPKGLVNGFVSICHGGFMLPDPVDN